MKIAVISDIHGNLPALEAVLADIDRDGCDFIINVGDTLGGPLESARIADLLMQRQIPMIAGNHEREQKTARGWHADLRGVPYDSADMVRLASLRGRPDWAHALATGFMPM